MDAEGTKVAEFILQHMSDIIEGLSEAGTMQAADKFFEKKLIESQTYDMIRKESIPAEKVRALYSAMRSRDPESYLVFYEYLKQKQQFLMNQLEEKARNETDSGPPGKKPRTEGPVQMQVQEARHETDSGSSLNFAGCTLSKLLEHVEDQKKMESLANSLELRLEDGGMKQIESLLKTRRLRDDVHFKHEPFRKMCVNKKLKAFMESKSQAKFPIKAIDSFFTGKNDSGKQSLSTQEESLHNSLIGSCDSGYDSLTQQSSLSFPNPPQEAQRELETGIGMLIPPSEWKQSNGATDMAVKSAAATASAATPRATASAATPRATASADTTAATSRATPAATASAATPVATASAAKSTDIVSATTLAATAAAARIVDIASADTPAASAATAYKATASGGSPAGIASAAKPAATASADTAAATASAATASADTIAATASTASTAATPATSAATAEATNSAASTATTASADTTAATSRATPAATASAATPVATASAAKSTDIVSATTLAATAAAARIVDIASADTPAASAATAYKATASGGSPAGIASAAKPAATASADTAAATASAATASADTIAATASTASTAATPATSAATAEATNSAASTVTTASADKPAATASGTVAADTVSAATTVATASGTVAADIVSAAKPADIASAATTAATASADTTAAPASGASSADIASAAKPADIASAAATAATASADTTAALASGASSATSAAKPAGTVAANGGRPNYGNPKKQEGRPRRKKSKLTNEQKVHILGKFLKNQIPSEKLETVLEEELKKMKTCITIVDFREHPRYPLLRAYDCIVFCDPKTNQKKLVEIFNDDDFNADIELNVECNFKVHFHMWLLQLSEAVVLSENKEKHLKVKSFQAEEMTFRQYLHDVVVPVLAIYKKVQWENKLTYFTKLPTFEST